jgi:hypothetical protein
MQTIQAKCYILIKLGPKEYMERLLNYGEVYMNSVSYYKNNKNPEIGDIFEGAEVVQGGKIVKDRDEFEKEKLYCMWHLNDQGTNSTGNLEYISAHFINSCFCSDYALIQNRRVIV